MKRSRDDGSMGGLPPKKQAGDPMNDEKREKLTTSDALGYLREVKTRFSNNRKVYDSFLEIMKQFKAQSIDTTGVIEKVKDLFKGHPELILGFNTFLPKGYEIRLDDAPKWQPQQQAPAPKAPVEFDQAISYVNKIKQRFAQDERVYKAFLEILNMYRKGQKTIANVYEEVALLFRNHNDLLQEFTYFLPDNSGTVNQGAARRQGAFPAKRAPAGYGAPPKTKRMGPALRRDDPKVQRELAFFEKVKGRLRSREAYADFLKCLNLFAEDVISKQELVSLVHDIVGKHPDLMAGLNEFLMRCELGPEDPYSRPYPRDRSRHANLQQKYITNPISELDVSTWERCTPSYVLLPTNYPKLKATGRSALGASLLNDDWVSVTSGSEDFSFKHYRKNLYEDALFRAEDDHFEFDVIIDQNASAIKALQPMAEQIAAMSEEERAAYQLPEGRLRAFHFRAVQRIYGEQGAYIVQLMRQNPAVAVPTVLARLVQKDEEWRTAKTEMDIQWQQIFKENFYKSLDHRSFYFKQAEKKTLTPKAMVQELRDVADRRRQEKAAVLQAVSGRTDFASRLSPHATYDYTDIDVHRDTAVVMQSAINSMLTGEQAEKVRHLYHAFMETYFELPCTCTEAEEQRTKAASKAAQNEAAAPAVAPSAAPSEPTSAMAGGDAAPGVGEETADDEEAGLKVLNNLANDKMDVETTEAESSEEEDAGPAPVAPEEDEEDESEFALCRPLVPLVQGVGAPAALPTPSPGADGILHPHCRILYANETICVLLRLHQILYDRMRTARKCAAQKAAAPATVGGAPVNTDTPPVRNEAAADIHSNFMAMVASLLKGTTDPSVYEDDVRELLGTNSYELFTLDKLLNKAVKQIQAVLAEEVSARLLELWRYENARTVPVMDSVYHSNAHIVLGDEQCYRIEHTGERMMTVQVMEVDKADTTPAILEPAFRDYVERFMANEKAPVAAASAAEGSRVCLTRHVPAIKDADEAAAAAEASMKGVMVVNGLECKLGSNAQQKIKKIAYVLGTEDYFHRVKAVGRVPIDSSDRATKFRGWVQSQGEAAAAAAPAAVAAPAAPAAEVAPVGA